MEVLIIVGIMLIMFACFGIAAFICDVIIAKFPKLEKLLDRISGEV